MSNSEQLEWYKQLFEKINNKKVDLNDLEQRQELYNFILQKRKVIN